MATRARRTNLNLNVQPPEVLQSNISFIDSLMSEEVGGGVSGIPSETWISLSGKPGARKTTLGIQMLNGFGQNPRCVAEHYDQEQGKYRCSQMYRRLGVTHISDLLCDSDIQGVDILDRVYEQANLLATEGKTYVALIDSFNYLLKEDSLKCKRDIAERLRLGRETHKNLIMITINHLTKTGAIGGPAEVQQKPDVLLSLNTKNGFVYLTAPKNRIQAPNAPDVIKLDYKDGIGLVESVEPDFISNLLPVQLARQLWSRYQNRKISNVSSQ